jgi:hypothetical protein
VFWHSLHDSLPVFRRRPTYNTWAREYDIF